MFRLFVFLILCMFVVIITGPAFAAANADWVKPATDLANNLETGMVKIGSVLVGIAIIIVGIFACFANRMDWDKFGYVLLGGVLIMAGPAALRALLATAP